MFDVWWNDCDKIVKQSKGYCKSDYQLVDSY